MLASAERTAGVGIDFMALSVQRMLLATFFIVGGLLHFVFPAAYIGIMPAWLPWHPELVLLSGAAEIAGGIGVLTPMLRHVAGIGLISLSIAVLPANVQMLLNALALAKPFWILALLGLRLPLQLLLIIAIWRLTQPRPV